MLLRPSIHRVTSRYLARIIQVFLPKSNLPLKPSPGPVASTSTSSSPLSDAPTAIHKVAEDLKIPVKDSIAMDDPAKYTYKVQILDEERQPGFGKADKSKGKETSRGQWSGHLLDVDCSKLG